MMDDPRAAEKERLERALAVLADLPDESVMGMAYVADQDAAFYARLRNRCRFEMQRRMNERDVTEVAGGDFKAIRKKGAASYGWDALNLELEVKPLLVGDEWDQLVEVIEVPARREVKVATAKLNNLAAKRKGELLAAVEASRTVTYAADSVDIVGVSQ